MLWKKAIEIGSDITQASQAAQNSAMSNNALTTSQMHVVTMMSICMLSLSHALDDIAETLDVASKVVLIAREMKNKDDVTIALKVTQLAIAEIEKHLPADRKIVGSIAGRCPDSALVNTKVQAALDFLTEVVKWTPSLGPLEAVS